MGMDVEPVMKVFMQSYKIMCYFYVALTMQNSVNLKRSE